MGLEGCNFYFIYKCFVNTTDSVLFIKIAVYLKPFSLVEIKAAEMF